MMFLIIMALASFAGAASTKEEMNLLVNIIKHDATFQAEYTPTKYDEEEEDDGDYETDDDPDEVVEERNYDRPVQKDAERRRAYYERKKKEEEEREEERKRNVDGKWSGWTDYGLCTVRCGGGKRMQTRECNNPPPKNNGANCQGETKQTVDCNHNSCSGCTTDNAPDSMEKVACGGGKEVGNGVDFYDSDNSPLQNGMKEKCVLNPKCCYDAHPQRTYKHCYKIVYKQDYKMLLPGSQCSFPIQTEKDCKKAAEMQPALAEYTRSFSVKEGCSIDKEKEGPYQLCHRDKCLVAPQIAHATVLPSPILINHGDFVEVKDTYQCAEKYFLVGESRMTCRDGKFRQQPPITCKVHPCYTGDKQCVNGQCEESASSYICKCNPGHYLTRNKQTCLKGHPCTAVDECMERKNGICPLRKSENMPDNCNCKIGYKRSSDKKCLFSDCKDKSPYCKNNPTHMCRRSNRKNAVKTCPKTCDICDLVQVYAKRAEKYGNFQYQDEKETEKTQPGQADAFITELEAELNAMHDA